MISKEIIARLKDKGKRFYAGDNISELESIRKKQLQRQLMWGELSSYLQLLLGSLLLFTVCFAIIN